MPALVLYLLVFLAVAVVFLFFHLLMGSVLRPNRPESEKLTIYECGEPTVGSAWIQFDLRYYVVALLFVVFDVEVAFFFPWAVVFGSLTTIANEPSADARAKLVKDHQLQDYRLSPVPVPQDGETEEQALERAVAEANSDVITQQAARSWAWVAFLDIVVFFGVLMVGFAYLWRRGDIDWVRTISHSVPVEPSAAALPPSRDESELATAHTKA